MSETTLLKIVYGDVVAIVFGVDRTEYVSLFKFVLFFRLGL